MRPPESRRNVAPAGNVIEKTGVLGQVTVTLGVTVKDPNGVIGVTPIVRVCAGALDEATRALDNGALGIVVPHVDTEADANRIRQNSLTPQLLELRRIENSRVLIDKWNGQLPTVQSGQGGALMLQLPRPQ